MRTSKANARWALITPLHRKKANLRMMRRFKALADIRMAQTKLGYALRDAQEAGISQAVLDNRMARQAY